MLIGDLSSKCVHATSSLARFDVPPNHRRHVPLVIHKACIEIWCFVGIWRDNVRAAAAERVFQEVEHCKEFAMGHKDVIAKEAEPDQYSSIRLVDKRVYPEMTE